MTLRIGGAGPMGRIPVAGEPGNQIIDALAPTPGEVVLDKPFKRAALEMIHAQGAIVGWTAPSSALLGVSR